MHAYTTKFRLFLYSLILFLSCFNLFSQTYYYSKSNGDLDVLNTWGSNLDGSGASPLNFTTTGIVYIVSNRTIATISSAWTVSGSGSYVQVGQGIMGVEFTIPSNFAYTGIVDVTNSSTLTILNTNNPNIGNLYSGSTVIYASLVNQTIINKAYYNLILTGTGQKLLANNINTSITNQLHIDSGVSLRLHTTSTLSVTLSGSITGTGAIQGNTNSNLIINGSGNAGTLTITSPNTLNQLILNRVSSGIIVLGSNLTISRDFTHTNGNLDLNGYSLRLQGAITFPTSSTNGAFIGSTTSSLTIPTSSYSISNALYMSQTSSLTSTLSRFTLNRIGATLVLGSNLHVSDNFVQTNGTIDLNNKALSINGTITFPLAISNGALVGSSASSLTIGGTGVINNSLKMDQSNIGTRTLNSFVIDHIGGTLSLGNDLICSGNFVHQNGAISIGPTLLTLNGMITFPLGAANGSFIGSSTSSINISGSDSIVNSMLMRQTNPVVNRTLNSFILNRQGEILNLGNPLIVNSFNHSSGIVNINGTLLTLNGDITFPNVSSNGGFLGSTSSSISIGGTGNIVNTLYMNQNNTSARTINDFTINRANQIIKLGNPLIVQTLNQINGIIDLNNNFLTINNAITFPVSSTNGYFAGSHTSTLAITGSGSITNTLKMDQTNSSTRSLFDLLFNRAGQTLNIGNGLEIRNSITTSSGNISSGGFVTLKSDSLRSAMLGVVGGSISGNLTVETFLPGGYTGWANLGPSGISSLTVADWEHQIPMTCFGCPYNEYSAGGYFVSIQGFNESGIGTSAYTPLSYTSALSSGNGYWVYVGNGFSTTSSMCYSVNGAPVTGNVVLPLTVSANSGYNLISNPYPAPIDWDLVSADPANTNINGAIYSYNADLGVSISYVSGISSPSGYMTGGIIPMGQGFFVQTYSNTTITFRESHKSTENSNANPVLKTNLLINPGTVIWLCLSGTHDDYDETAIRFHPDATYHFDQYLDAFKIFETPGYLGTSYTYSKYTTISSQVNNEDYSINSLPINFGTPITIPILAKVMTTGEYKIAVKGIHNFPNHSCVILKDKLLNKFHDLNSGTYTCNIVDTTASTRFELIICDVSTSITHNLYKSNTVKIIQSDGSNVLVNLKFDKNVASTISVINILGQKVSKDISIYGTENNIELSLINISDKMVIIKVLNEYGVTTKKIIVK